MICGYRVPNQLNVRTRSRWVIIKFESKHMHVCVLFAFDLSVCYFRVVWLLTCDESVNVFIMWFDCRKYVGVVCRVSCVCQLVFSCVSFLILIGRKLCVSNNIHCLISINVPNFVFGFIPKIVRHYLYKFRVRNNDFCFVLLWFINNYINICSRYIEFHISELYIFLLFQFVMPKVVFCLFCCCWSNLINICMYRMYFAFLRCIFYNIRIP